MKRSVRLSLKKETLAALTTDDMRGVAGAVAESRGTCYTCLDCLIEVHPSVLAPTNCCQGIPTFHRAGGAAC